MFAYSPDLAQAVLAGSKNLDAAYEDVRTAKQPLDAKVDRKVRRKVARCKVARSKKVAVLSSKACTSHDKGREIGALAKPPGPQRSLAEAAMGGEKVSAITARSACDLEEPKMSDGTEEIKLGKVIARLRRVQARNPDTMRVCDALERRLQLTPARDRSFPATSGVL